MAINTELNSKLANQMFAIYTKAEEIMLGKVAKRVKKGITEEGWNEFKLKDMQALTKELSALKDDLDTIATSEISEAISNAYKAGVASAEADFKMVPSIMSNTHVPPKVQHLILSTNQLVTQSNMRILRSTIDAYRQIQGESAVGILQGVETRKDATKRMLNRLADSGITSFVDKAGRKWEMASYAEMAMRTVSAKASIMGHLDRQLQAGRDLVIVSQHMGSCKTCAKYAGHILSIAGTPGYTSVAEATAGGLFHPNCKHTLSGYIEGLSSEKSVSQVNQKKSDEMYDESQKQRANERAIRRWKRREIVAIDPKDRALANSKIREYQKKQRELLERYEQKFGVTMPRKYDRESIKNRTGTPTGEKKQQWSKIKGQAGIKPKPPTPPLAPVTFLPTSDAGLNALSNTMKSYLSAKAKKYDNYATFHDDLMKVQAGKDWIKACVAQGKATGLSGDALKSDVFNALKNADVSVVKKASTVAKQTSPVVQQSMEELMANFNPDDFVDIYNLYDSAERKKRFINHSRKFLESLPKPEITGIIEYSDSTYRQMNGALRNGGKGWRKYANDHYSGNIEKFIDNATAGLSKSPPITESIKVYRKVDHSGSTVRKAFGDEVGDLASDVFNSYSSSTKKSAAEAIKQRVVGGSYSDKGFTSTTYEYGRFGGDSKLDFHFYLPKGYNRGTFIESHSSHSSEKEFLINRGEEFEVFDVELDHRERLIFKLRPKVNVHAKPKVI